MSNTSSTTAKKSFDINELYKKYGNLFILAIIFAFSAIFAEGFLTQANLTNVLRQIVVVTILAFGATYIIILGHINIAYGSMLALYGCFAADIMVKTGSVFLAVAAATILGALIGLFYGVVVTRYKIPAFIMGLALQTGCRGAVMLYTNAQPISNLGNFNTIGQGSIGIVPISVIILFALFGLSWFILNKTCFGRHVYAVGGNKNAAVASGIKADMIVIKAFVFDGILTGIAGIVFTSRMATGQPGSGIAYEFDAITAVVVGGTSMAGGAGTIGGTLIGAVIVGMITNAQNLFQVSGYWQNVLKGVIILLAVIIDVKTKSSGRVRKK